MVSYKEIIKEPIPNDNHVRRGNLTIHEDGSFEIHYDPSGLPAFTGVVPAPSINTKNETERMKRHDSAIEGIICEGYWIESTKRIHNDAFDAGGEKTTLKVSWRTCKTREEVEATHHKIIQILKTRMKEGE